MSIGKDRVRVKFNPSATGLVDQIKQRTAELIDICNFYDFDLDDKIVFPEEQRLWKLAMTAYEEAAMWAVKAATFKRE